ncbi:MAG: flippase [Desulfosarcinaceae bacterium]|nr:flippase [Desulfosarcinaceae bacterium]
MDSSIRSQLARGAGGTFAVKIAAMAAGLSLQVLLARIMDVENFGTYAFVITWVNFGVIFGKMGFDTASLRYVTAYNSARNPSKLSGFIAFSSRFTLVSGLLAGAAAIGIFHLSQESGHQLLVGSIWAACLLLTPLNTLIYTFNAQLRGVKCIVPSQAANDILRPTCILILLLSVHFGLNTEANAPFALAVHAVSAGAVLAIIVSLRRKHIGPLIHQARPRFESRNWLQTALPLLGISLANLVIAQADVLLIGTLTNATEVGRYVPARRIGNLITVVLTSVNTIAAPLFAELYTQNRRTALQETVTRAARWIFMFSVPCCVLTILFAKPLLMVFGDDFVSSHQALQIIAAAQLVNALAGSVGFLMIMAGQQNKAAAVVGCSAVLNLVLNYLWIPPFGILGAAWASFITTVLWNLSMLILTVRCLGINPTLLPLPRLGKAV